MGLKCGIIGLPNVGKSTIFNALTKATVEVANFPFCTIKPHIGVVPVPDQRLKRISDIIKPKSIIPTTITFIDIAGLIKGASKGEGLGNKFLATIRETEALVHVIRCFQDETVVHCSGQLNPLEDINLINTELALADLETCEKALLRMRVNKKTQLILHNNLKFKTLESCRIHLEKVGTLRGLNLSEEENFTIRDLHFFTLKPILYIANINENYLHKKNVYVEQVKKFAEQQGTIVITMCALLESDVAQLKNHEYNDFMMELRLKECALNNLIRESYKLLKLKTYFTVGIKEVRAWTIPEGTTAYEAAKNIHSDIKKGFIKAQIISYEDFITTQGEQAAKEAGKVHIEGKDYLVKDGDIIKFFFKI
ncbi:MAG: redox-regulated ATPase YchF [Candidatus Dasytiphilus stammeri]